MHVTTYQIPAQTESRWPNHGSVRAIGWSDDDPNRWRGVARSEKWRIALHQTIVPNRNGVYEVAATDR